ncbi:nucleolar protein 10 [Impatiens glandulifera]|uniref:nucleolar protein 10 n=1 Tax=Impatiens glandulifera TaxID=253017 RepID=UPI001FB0AC80|nr:nucleolar protein 10 [Impatiens glandulifera]
MANHGGNLKGASTNGVKMYSVTGNRSVATWLPPKKLRALRKDNDYQKRVELVQDLKFEIATSRIKASPDGEFLIASGIYPPQVKVYELRELSLKFERHLISEIVDFEILSDDYSKIAFLCADRSVNLHAKYGSHYSLRIPRMGRDLAYDSWSCDLLCAASSPDLYRINLEQGRFLSSISTQSPALNVVARSKLHGLVSTGGDDGAVECFDMRVRSSVGRINAVDEEVTAIQFDGGYQMAVGSSVGKVLLYDLRSSRPFRTKDHMLGSPIVDIKWHQTLNYEHPKLITADKLIVRIWDPETGEDMTNIEPTAGSINDVCIFNGSGLVLLGLDCNQIPSYFIPSLGPAPKWCSYLENLTEELEESAEATIYDNFKYVTREELEELNSTNLIGTDYLRAYMHGFFMDYRLYKKAKDIAAPFNKDAYIEQRKREKIEALSTSRITIKRKLPKVNRDLYSRLHENDEPVEENKDVDGTNTDVKRSSKKRKGLNSDIVKDDRFNSIFENKDFEIDEMSQEYMALHPMGSTKQQSSSLVEEHFEPIMEEDEDQATSDEDDDDDNGDGLKKKSRQPRLYEVKDERHAEAFYNRVSLSKEDALPMGERVAALNKGQNWKRNADEVKMGAGGSREISFVSKSSARYKEHDDDDMMDDRREKRGVKSLGLKSEKLPYGGGGRGHRGGRGRSSSGGGGRGRGGGGGGGRGGGFGGGGRGGGFGGGGRGGGFGGGGRGRGGGRRGGGGRGRGRH